MIIQVNGCKYANEFASIYNSANLLFEENRRCDADEKVFYKQLREDDNFIYMRANEICGFMSCHRYEEYCELTSLYIKRECQGMKIGHQLLEYFEKQIEHGSYSIIKVLNNADWASAFYKKHGYQILNEEMYNLIRSWNMTEKAWEKILYKKLGN